MFTLKLGGRERERIGKTSPAMQAGYRQYADKVNRLCASDESNWLINVVAVLLVWLVVEAAVELMRWNSRIYSCLLSASETVGVADE